MVEIPTAWLTLNRTERDLEGQVYRNVRNRILDGQLAAGQRLPPSRALAASLGVARSTIIHAYERLRAEGFIEATAGSATRVAPLPAPPHRPHPPLFTAPHRPCVPPVPEGLFQPGLPDLSAFPHTIWARCLAARARALRVHDLGYQSPSGLPELRAAILAHISATRGVSASADQVIVLPSTGTAIDLVARLLLRPDEPGRDLAWIEEPGYPVAQALLRQAGARLAPVACDAWGMDVGLAPGRPPRLIYVSPSHQYPTGATMSLPRRLALLKRAEADGALVLENDYDSEYHYRMRPIAALQGIDRGGCVAYMGTFSKVLAPGLRVAYAVLPTRLVPEASAALSLRGTVVPIHMQAALADFMREGHLRAHIRRMSEVYATRMAVMIGALRHHCGDRLELESGDGGLQLAGWFRDPDTDDRAVAAALNALGIAVRALSDFYLGVPRPGLLFGIARATAEVAESGARRIALVLGTGVGASPLSQRARRQDGR